MDTTKDKVQTEIERSKGEQILFLQELVRTRSDNWCTKDPTKSSPYDPVELGVAELIHEKLEEIGLQPKFEGISRLRPNVVCDLGKREKASKTIIFNGHMDTTPLVQNWDFEPFSATIKGGKLYGCGALDMKSSLSAYVFMAKALLKFEDELEGRINLQFVVDEEPMAASHFGTHYLLEKGYVGDAAIIGEPGTKKVVIGNKGGYRFKLETYGKAIHTGSKKWERREEGVNAILEMTKAIRALQDFDFPVGEHWAFPGRKNDLTFPTVIEGGEAINIVPDLCVALGESRLLPGVTREYMESEIRKRLDKLGISYKLYQIVYVPPVFIEPKEPIVQALKKNAKEILAREPVAKGSGPWSDMWMFIKRGIPAVNFGCDGSGVHDKNEYVDIQSVIDVTKIYAMTALDFLAL